MKKITEILQDLLKVIVGALQIAVDRGADSGVIDFKEPITKARRQIIEAVIEMMPKEVNRDFGAKKLNDELLTLSDVLDDYRKFGYNQYHDELKQSLLKLAGEKD